MLIEKLSKAVPLMTGMLIFLSIAQLSVYYHAFNISINSFLTFSEIVTSFLDDNVVVTLLGSTLAYSFGYFSGMHRGRIWELKDKKEIKDSLKIPVIHAIFQTMLTIALVVTYFFWEEYFTLLLGLYIIMFGTNYVYMKAIRIRLKYREDRAKDFDEFTYRAIVYSLMFIVLLSVLTFWKIENVKAFKSNIGVEFIVSGHKIGSDSTHYYIGNTNEYLFYYHEDDDRTVVYKMENVSEIIFPERKFLLEQ